MKFGFNSKTQVGPDLYDVQTEDRGVSHPFIDTLVLIRGRVVYRHSTSYEDLAANGALDQAILRARVEKQHREIVEAFIEAAAGAPESHCAQTDAEGRTSLQFPFPNLTEPSLAALVIRAHVAEGLGELRYQLKPKRTNP